MHALKQAYAPVAEPAPVEAETADVTHPALRASHAVSPARADAFGPSPRHSRRVQRLKAHAISILFWTVSLSLLLGIWYVGTKYRLQFYIRFTNIPTPMEVIQKLLEVNQSPKFLMNIGISVRRILLGFSIATLIGVPLGLLIGRYKPVRGLLLPICEVLRPIPAIAWVPMSIMLWPNNEASIVYITFLGSFFPILLNTIHGVESIDKVLIRAAQCLGASEAALLRSVVLPGAAPHIFTGLAVGMGVAWVSLIAAEMISGQFGVGYFTWEAYSLVNYAEIVLGMITIGVLGLACSGAIRTASRLAMPWLSYSTEKR